jgi:hypothetical protein
MPWVEVPIRHCVTHGRDAHSATAKLGVLIGATGFEDGDHPAPKPAIGSPPSSASENQESITDDTPRAV